MREATELAKPVGAVDRARLAPTSPCPGQRLREEARQAPADLQWMVNPREDVDATLSDAAERGRRRRAWRSTTYAREGDPADAILDVAEERGADLIVVGNKGMTGAKRFLLGSVPNKVSPPRALLGADHPHDLSGGRSARGQRPASVAAARRRRSPAP